MKNDLVKAMMKMTAALSDSIGNEVPNAKRIAVDAALITKLILMFDDKQTRRTMIQTNLKMMKGYRNEDFSKLFMLISSKATNEDMNQIREFIDEWEAKGRQADESNLVKVLEEKEGDIDPDFKSRLKSTLAKLTADFDGDAPEEGEEECECVNCRLKAKLVPALELAGAGELKEAELIFLTALIPDPDYEGEQVGDIIKAAIYLNLKHGLDVMEEVTNFAYSYNTLFKTFDEPDGKSFALAIISASPVLEEGRERVLGAIRSDIYDHDNVDEKGRWCRQAEINTGLVGFAKAEQLRDMVEFDKLVNNIMQFEDTFPEFQEHFDRYKVLFDKVRKGELNLEDM